jgi:outer membrane protein assembly factor BamB
MNIRRTCTLLVPLAAMPLDAQGAAANGWPHWRGPNRDGISPERAWNPEGVIVWRAEVGLGYSNVSMADGRLFTLGHDPEQEQEIVVCLDLATGQRIWEHRYPEPTAAKFHGGGSNSTPTIAGEAVFVAGRNGRCFAFAAASGVIRWERDYQGDLGLQPADFGYSASPVVVGDDVFLALGATLLCVGAASGEVRWQVKLGDTQGYATPHPFTRAGKPALAAFSGEALVVVGTADGEELHRYPWEGDIGSVNAGTPIVVGDDVFISSAYEVGAARLLLGDAREPELVWRTQLMRNMVSGCTLFEGHVYGFDESMLKCLSFEDGSERWRVRGLGMGAVAVAGGRLLVLSSDGELIVAEATPQVFRELSRTKVLDGGVYWTTPVLLDGRIYCRNSLGNIVCLDHRPRASLAQANASKSEPEPAGPLPGALTLLRAHVLKIGGARLAERNSLHVDGTYENTGAGVTRTAVSVDWLKPDKWRIEWQLAGFGSALRGYDGQNGWQADPFRGTFLYEEAALRELAEASRLHAPIEWVERAESFRTQERTRFDNRDCWSVAQTSPGGAQRTLYFEFETGLLAGRDGDGEAMVVYRDYREFDGVWLPTFVHTLMPDTGAKETVRVEKATWDTVKASLFLPPDAIARKLRPPEEKAAEEVRLTKAHGHLFGTYASDAHPAHAFTVEDGALVLKVAGQSGLLEEPDEGGRFRFTGMPGMSCTFEVDEQGLGRALVLDEPGQEPIRLERVEEE